LSKFIDAVVGREVGRSFPASRRLKSGVTTDHIKSECLTEFLFEVRWASKTFKTDAELSAHNSQDCMQRDMARRLSHDVYGEFFQLLNEIKEAAYEGDLDAVKATVAELMREVKL